MLTQRSEYATELAYSDRVQLRYWVVHSRREAGNITTLILRPEDEAIPPFRPGQFAMLSFPDTAEVPAAISGDPTRDDGTLTLTVHSVDAPNGTVVSVSGPFGPGWDLTSAEGTDLMLLADGIGLALLRPALLYALRYRRRYRRITLATGAHIYGDELEAAAINTDTEVVETVDAIHQLRPALTTALLCGPEPTMRAIARTLRDHGVPDDRIQLLNEVGEPCPHDTT